MNQDSCNHHFLKLDKEIASNSKKAALVLFITLITMILEIYFGYMTGSMALLADGWHMATHAAALGITYITYRLATNPQMVRKFNFGGGKIIALGGFASSVFLLCVVLLIGFEAAERILNPVTIQFNEALIVAVVGLIINIICAFILQTPHSHGHTHHNHDISHDYSHSEKDHRDHISHDHNIRGAYYHVLADAVTSVCAIVALIAGKYYSLGILDPIVGIVGSLVILKWAIQLIKDTGWELLDGHALGVNFKSLKNELEAHGGKIQDLHVWKIAPNMLACELIIVSQPPRGLEHYRHILQHHYKIDHSVIEERVQS